MSMPWFRVYSDILDDRKIKRIHKKTGHSKALIIGVWVSLLALANDSPTRGTLVLSENMPVTQEDLEDELELPGEIINQLIDEFIGMSMINGEGTLKITNWEKRQFKSDNSTERVREHREKRSNETLQKRYNGVIDTEERREESEERREEEWTASLSARLNVAFMNKTHITNFNPRAEDIKAGNHMAELGVLEIEVEKSVDILDAGGYTIVGLASIEKTAIGLMRKRTQNHKDDGYTE